MLPFTRNVFDPMDYTPLVLDRIPNIERRTSAAFQLALSVLYTSGIQHYAEVPAGMAKAPGYVRDFLKSVPSVWDDVVFVAGEPGDYAVLARKAGDRWYVAGINGGDASRQVSLDTARFGTGQLIRDGNDALGFAHERALGPSYEVTMPARGGFVAVLGGDD
jgi:hypothetical protein